jgi:hypothetical protein
MSSRANLWVTSDVRSTPAHHRHETSHPLFATRAQARDDFLIAEPGKERFARRDKFA